MMKIAVTGAGGVVGGALIGELDPARFEVTPLDLPEHDVSDLDELVEATKGHDAIVHCAWSSLKDNYTSGTIEPVNTQMIFNVYQAAVTNGIPRVVMASSNHAHRHDMPDEDGSIRASIQPPVPDSPYGAEKVFMEALGRFFATSHDLGVVCLRIGNVNKDNRPNDDVPNRWLSYGDLGRLVTCSLEVDPLPENFQIVYGVSQQDVFDWTNSIGYEPQDSAT